ncbi:MAG: ATP-binding cassette domain-containing protein [Planctomycetaceae bacterium]
MADATICARGLRKHFGDVQVLRGVDLTVPKGAVVGLLGTNGTGKSTLIKCLLGLLRLTAGTATVFGEDPWRLSAASKARLGYAPQVVHLYPWMKVQQVVDYTGAFYRSWDRQWCSDLMRRWELDGSAWIRNLSTGQLQRLGLILAMGHRPDLYILDEPASSLDPKGRRDLLRSLLEITRDSEHTVLFSTHITSDLERVASHVAILSDGVIDYFGELDELKDSVKRIRVHSHANLPLDFEIPGALRTEINGKTAVVAVTSVDDESIDRIRSRWDVTVDVEDLNLEDIFLELHDA